MRADSFRFKPPASEPPAAAIWALQRAFGRPDAPPAGALDPDRALRWASTLGLAPRIAHRIDRDLLDRDLGRQAAAVLRRQRSQASARALLLETLLERVLACAGRLGAAVVALKGMALLKSGITPFGSREVGDLDVLVPEDHASELAVGLRRLGLRPTGEAATASHDPPLAHPELGLVEIHRRLPGVEVDSGKPASTGDLLEPGLCRAARQPTGLWVPTARILAAHAAAHAIDQHGFSPHAYPLTRVVADLLDLAAFEHRSIAELLQDAAPMLRRSVSARELRAAAALCEGLARGSASALKGDARALLRHTVAGLTAAGYRRRLRLAAGLTALRRREWRRIGQAARRQPRAADSGASSIAVDHR